MSKRCPETSGEVERGSILNDILSPWMRFLGLRGEGWARTEKGELRSQEGGGKQTMPGHPQLTWLHPPLSAHAVPHVRAPPFQGTSGHGAGGANQDR